MEDLYEDIINLPHHVSRTRSRMSMEQRAAQFSPFAAVTGHKESILEVQRITEKKKELDETVKDSVNRRLQIIACEKQECEPVTIEYYVPDEKKSGGMYKSVYGKVRKIESIERIIVMEDGTDIPIDDILSITGETFPNMVDEC